jgi:hypothetical protein
MSKRTPIIILLLLLVSFDLCQGQGLNSTAGLFRRQYANLHMGELNIYQDPGIDSLISRYILYNLRLNGMNGFRIQIYSSSDKNAREEAGKIRAEFISEFPDIKSYPSFDKPSYYKIRAGDYRTRIEGTKYLLMVRKVFPDAYLVPDVINFPDLNIK